MNRLYQLALVFILMISSAAPVMACVLPEAAMSAQERRCCDKMKSLCGRESMPASHACCHQVPIPTRDCAIENKKSSDYSPSPAVLLAALAVWQSPVQVFHARVEEAEFVPPKSLPSSNSILRI